MTKPTAIAYDIYITRTDKYLVEIDADIWNDKHLEEWGRTFYEMDRKEIAQHIAGLFMQYRINHFFEGFGYIESYDADGERNEIVIIEDGEFKRIKETCEGIRVKIFSREEDFDCDTKIIQPKKEA